MDVFNNQITLSFNSLAFISIVLVFFAFVVIGVILYRRSKQRAQKQNYGFLGKTIYGVVTVVLFSTIVLVSVSNLSQNQFFDIKAKKNVQADILVNKISEDIDEAYVSFKAIPSVNSIAWGEKGDKFDIYWNLKGPENYTFFESGKSSEDTSSLQKNVVKGTYQINVIIIFDDASYTFDREANF